MRISNEKAKGTKSEQNGARALHKTGVLEESRLAVPLPRQSLRSCGKQGHLPPLRSLGSWSNSSSVKCPWTEVTGGLKVAHIVLDSLPHPGEAAHGGARSLVSSARRAGFNNRKQLPRAENIPYVRCSTHFISFETHNLPMNTCYYCHCT